ncbi:MFS transporter [Leptolyngbya sp. NIES-2104]|uniref:MFS transporter n=1 Tax=Leptolyngbya sp. NIES-2104 TaxID=1552121 RepID=UPI0006ECA694|nr:MFS transporter [Leptolyngbya sp. NIES-2104]GAP99771.1 nickel resistance protein NREB [Leptolyngbya sp. NIES-2104]
MSRLPPLLKGLENPIFARLYLAQTINLVGDSLTWLGLALLAFELAGQQSGTILAGALTLRVMAFVVLSPLAGAIADRVDRKRLMILTHLARMFLVCLLPFVTQVWQIYAIVLALNAFYAFFTPTYTATIPLVTGEENYPHAIALSSATYQFLGVLGPGLAGSIAAFVGTRQVFFLDGLTFLAATILLFTLPGQLMVRQSQQSARTVHQTIQDIRTGTTCLWSDPVLRSALVMQFVAAIAGAEILVNTVGYIQGSLQLGKLEYSWTMAAFGIGATLASIGLGNATQNIRKNQLIYVGTILLTVALLPANFVNLQGLLILWLIAGAGETLVNVPTQTLIADRIAVEVQGRVYGAHFAWSHLWWAFAYPIAGWMGSHAPNYSFFYSGFIGLGLAIVLFFMFKPWRHRDSNSGIWHDHDHVHNEQHQHNHFPNLTEGSHRHLHFHTMQQEH